MTLKDRIIFVQAELKESMGVIGILQKPNCIYTIKNAAIIYSSKLTKQNSSPNDKYQREIQNLYSAFIKKDPIYPDLEIL